MNEKSKDILIAAAIFVLAIIFGGFFIEKSNYGYTESALLYLAGVMAAGLFWSDVNNMLIRNFNVANQHYNARYRI